MDSDDPAVIDGVINHRGNWSNVMIEWIKVEDRLPDNDNWVIISTKDEVSSAYFSLNGGWFKFIAGSKYPISIMNSSVTHWQPMPEPPK